MEAKQLRAVVAGDVSIDWLEWPVSTRDSARVAPSCNWQLHDGLRLAARPGGALLLAVLLREAGVAIVGAPEIPDLEDVPVTEVLRSHIHLDRFPVTSNGGGAAQAWRVRDDCGYVVPNDGRVKPWGRGNYDLDAGLVILDDAGNGFRDQPGVWPHALVATGNQPLVLLRMSRPLAAGPLFEELSHNHADRLVVVVDADDLRCAGANISRRLSWERTAKDFLWQMANNRGLGALASCHNLVVRFGLDGAIHRAVVDGRPTTALYYDPAGIEGDFGERHPGRMLGLEAAFLATLAGRVAEGGLDRIGDGARAGIAASRRLLRMGFGESTHEPTWVFDRLFEPCPHDPPIAGIVVPVESGLTSADPDFWTILQESTREGLERVAFNYVETGADPALDRVPVGRFGNLKTIDRTEIEGYRSVKNLILEYLAAGYVKRPLCIGVFGPPGAGKTYSVTQIARGVGEGAIESLSFNVAQWESPRDLASALHHVRDAVLEGYVPLVFFDEFDASFEGASLGWLKFFLDPMQDGRFKDGESSHPIGKAIFVFAGATSGSLAEFTRDGCDTQAMERFRMAKGPDFVSRLRGYVEILGINQRNERDRLYVIRRAIALRALLETSARQLIDRSGGIRIDPGVLRALIKIPMYRHGMRSLESLIDMSMLSGRETFDQSALPPAPQLDLHVDAGTFTRLVARDVLVGAAREKIAQAIHADFVKEDAPNTSEEVHMRSWDGLTEHDREANREQADWFPTYLEAIGCGFLPSAGENPPQVEFNAEEVEKLAQLEHERWWAQKRAAGYVFGSVRSDTERTHPSMVPWDQLSGAEKEKDREAVRNIPERMAAAGFETYRVAE